MNTRPLRPLVLLLLAALPLAAATPPKKAAKGAPAAPAAAGSAKVSVSLDGLVDRRSSSDFPTPSLEIALKLEGDDADAVVSALAKVTKAEDDTGRSLLRDRQMQQDMWQERRGENAPRPSFELVSPSRKAKAITTLEGKLSAYLPSHDPAAVVKVEKIASRTDKPPIAAPALAAQKIRLQVLSKEGLEKERKAAEAAKAKKKAASKKKGGLEEMGEAMGDALSQMFERLFMMVGEHDLVLKVDDPESKIFSFGIIGPDGKPFSTYGDTKIENYRIVRSFEPLPQGAALEVRLKTAKSFAEVPFRLTNVKLP